MAERALLRIGGVSAIMGAILGIVVNALFPRVADPGDKEALLRTVAESALWTGNSVGVILAGLLLLGGLVALYRSITTGVGAAWARLGYAAALAGAAMFFAWAAVSGFALSRAAEAWAGASTDKATAFLVASSMADISFALFAAWTSLFFGAAFLLYGLAIATSDVYPRWLGWVAVVGGAGSFLIGVVQFYQGPSTLWTNYLFAAFSVALTVWVFVIGVLMWRRASAAV